VSRSAALVQPYFPWSPSFTSGAQNSANDARLSTAPSPDRLEPGHPSLRRSRLFPRLFPADHKNCRLRLSRDLHRQPFRSHGTRENSLVLRISLTHSSIRSLPPNSVAIAAITSFATAVIFCCPSFFDRLSWCVLFGRPCTISHSFGAAPRGTSRQERTNRDRIEKAREVVFAQDLRRCVQLKENL
jgi:hypothetical protein